MKKSFVELLNEIVNDFKQIHIKIKNNKFIEIDVFSKISELLRLAEEVENYTTNNLNIIEKIYTMIYVCFGAKEAYIKEKTDYKGETIINYLDNPIIDIILELERFLLIHNRELIYSNDLDVFEFESECAKILNCSSTVNKPPPPPKPPLKFIDLFKIPYNTVEKITILKEILKNNEYIGQDNKWVGITKKKNELAFLYDLFNEKNILKDESFELQIKTFYKEFGLIVYNDKETKSGGYCTLKNLRITRSNQNETYKNFEIIFSDWVK